MLKRSMIIICLLFVQGTEGSIQLYNPFKFNIVQNIQNTTFGFLKPLVPLVCLGLENSIIGKTSNYVPNAVKSRFNACLNFLNKKIILDPYQDNNDRAGTLTFSSITKMFALSGMNSLFLYKFLHINPLQSLLNQLIHNGITMPSDINNLEQILEQVLISSTLSAIIFSTTLNNVTHKTYKQFFNIFGYSAIDLLNGLVNACPLLTIQNFLIGNHEENQYIKKSAMLLLCVLACFGIKYYFVKNNMGNSLKETALHTLENSWWKSVLITTIILAIDYRTNGVIHLRTATQQKFNIILEEKSIFNTLPAQMALIIFVEYLTHKALQNYKTSLIPFNNYSESMRTNSLYMELKL